MLRCNYFTESYRKITVDARTVNGKNAILNLQSWFYY